MTNNRISVVIPQKTIDDALALLKQVETLLAPFLIDALSQAEIKHLLKMGEASEAFVSKGLEFATSQSQLVPSWVNVAEAKLDEDLYNDLRQVDTALSTLTQKVYHTRCLAGSEALDAINDFYKSTKAAKEKGLAEAIPVFEELSKRYAAQGKPKKKPVMP